MLCHPSCNQRHTYRSPTHTQIHSFCHSCVVAFAALSPFRTQHFTNLSMWSSAGYDPTDTSNFLANSAVGLNHGNVATDLQVRQASQLKCVCV